MTATIAQSKCVAYDTVTIYNTVTLTVESVGAITYELGTANTNLTSVTWESITPGTALSLANPNKALFFRANGDVGAILSEVKIIYS